jgi:RNA polymerase sigma factor (sigma-70 family)
MMLRRAALDELRRLGRRRQLLLSAQAASEPALQPDALLESLVTRAALHEALEKVERSLTAEDRLLLKLRFWQERSISGIARTLGISYSAAAVRIFRLLNKLREEMPARM